MQKNLLRQLLVILGTVVTLAVNALANILPFNGVTTGEVSDRYPAYFVPAGYVFAIWGLIYLALLAFSIYQALPKQRETPALVKIRVPYLVTCLANSIWIFFWHYGLLVWTLVFMGVLLVMLIAIYLLVGIGRGKPTVAERWLVHIPFSLYLGWITVATIANVTTVLYALQWSGWGLGPVAWAAIMLLVAAAVASTAILTRHDFVFGLVVVWATVGISVKQIGTPLVAIVAGLAALIVIAALVGTVWRWRRADTQAG